MSSPFTKAKMAECISWSRSPRTSFGKGSTCIENERTHVEKSLCIYKGLQDALHHSVKETNLAQTISRTEGRRWRKAPGLDNKIGGKTTNDVNNGVAFSLSPTKTLNMKWWCDEGVNSVTSRTVSLATVWSILRYCRNRMHKIEDTAAPGIQWQHRQV